MFDCCIGLGKIPKEHLFFEIYCVSRDNLIPNPSNHFIYWTIKDKLKLLDTNYLVNTFTKHLLLTYGVYLKEPIYVHVYPLEITDNNQYTNGFCFENLNPKWIPFLQYFRYLFYYPREDQVYKLMFRICRQEYQHLIRS